MEESILRNRLNETVRTVRSVFCSFLRRIRTYGIRICFAGGKNMVCAARKYLLRRINTTEASW